MENGKVREMIKTAFICVLSCLVAFLVYFALPSNGSKKQVVATQEVQVEGALLPIAVVNTDSISMQYTFAVEGKEKLASQYEEAILKLDSKAKALQKEAETFQQDYLNFQKKVEVGAFLSRERAESEAAKLEKKQQQLMAKEQDLENLRQQLSNEFMANQAALVQQLQDSVEAYLREYNADGHLHLIINDAVVLNKVAGYDITEEVVEALNARYKK